MKAKELILTLTASDLFKFIITVSTAFYIPIAIIFGLLALGGIVPATLNETQYTGIKGLLISIVMAPIIIAIIAISHWVVLAIGLKLSQFWFRNIKKYKLN
ncbi:hypothetical protein [Labilibacter marinus]|uniref:hypothetical protein n=1 Tax=Labilibacter marinus TaxID=1477105 RepID=UPI00094FD071|nr:hypothetical protein [Labilibacter marinus]